MRFICGDVYNFPKWQENAGLIDSMADTLHKSEIIFH